MRTFSYTNLLNLLGLLALAGNLTATPIPVANHSFEDTILANGSFTGFPNDTDAPGSGVWKRDQAFGAGIENPFEDPNYYLGGAPTFPTDGVNVAFSDGPAFWQDLGIPWQGDTTYLLEVDVAARGDSASDPVSQISLRNNGGTILASESITITSRRDAITLQLLYQTPSTAPSGNIEIWLDSLDDFPPQSNFDNVRLTMVPEPATYATLGTALAAGLLSRRKRETV